MRLGIFYVQKYEFTIIFILLSVAFKRDDKRIDFYIAMPIVVYRLLKNVYFPESLNVYNGGSQNVYTIAFSNLDHLHSEHRLILKSNFSNVVVLKYNVGLILKDLSP